MMVSANNKRKVSDKCRLFQDHLTDAYLFVEVQQKPVCLVCNEPVAVMKEYNFKWHHKTKNSAKFNALQGQVRSIKVSELKKKLTTQQFTFKKPTFEAEACVEVSCIIAQKLQPNQNHF